MALSLRESLHTLADQLPEGATLDDVMLELYERHIIEAGLADSESGRVTSLQVVREKYGLS